MSDRVLVMHGGRARRQHRPRRRQPRDRRAPRWPRAAAGRGRLMTAPTPRSPTSRPRAAARRGSSRAYGQEIVIACAIVALFVVVSAVNPRFLGANNLNTIVSGNAYIAVAAIGMSMIIITGHIDVSVGALIGVLATISGTLAVSGYPIWVAWIGADPDRRGGQRRRRRAGRLWPAPVDRRHPRHALDPQGRPGQRHRRRLDQQPAAGVPARPARAGSASRRRSGSW